MSVEREDFTDEFLRDVERGAERFVRAGGLVIESNMKRIVTQKRIVDTGRLRASITSNVDSDGDGPYSDTGPNVDYAEYVEYGTSRQPARPYAEPGFQASRPAIDALAARELKT